MDYFNYVNLPLSGEHEVKHEVNMKSVKITFEDYSAAARPLPPHINQGCTNPGRRIAVEIKFGTVTPNICTSSVWNMLYLA
jgi:hypothetical protein